MSEPVTGASPRLLDVVDGSIRTPDGGVFVVGGAWLSDERLDSTVARLIQLQAENERLRHTAPTDLLIHTSIAAVLGILVGMVIGRFFP